jgi:hypothetical protein
LVAPGVLAFILLGCGSAAPTIRPDCPVGETTLDGTCVSQPIADYVACIRATGATVATNSARQLSAAAGVAGVTANTQAEVQDKLEKSYAKVSDANAQEIIRDCRSKTARSDEPAPRHSESSATPLALEGPSSPTVANPVAPLSAPVDTPVVVVDTSPTQRSASTEGPTIQSGRGTAASRFAGSWQCVDSVDVTPLQGRPLHFQITDTAIAVDNGDGTVTFVGSKDDGQCPPVPLLVSGNKATAGAAKPCYKQNGEVMRLSHADANLSGGGLKISLSVDSVGRGPGRIDVVCRCAR